MPKRCTPPSSNALLKSKTTSTKKTAKKPKTKAPKTLEIPRLPTPHESQLSLITSGGEMLEDASSVIVAGEEGVTGAGKTIILGHIMRNEAEKTVRVPDALLPMACFFACSACIDVVLLLR